MTDDVKVLKEASCPSLSAQSILTYEIGTNSTDVYFRIVKNSGNGIFSSESVQLHAALALLHEAEGPFVWEALRPLFPNRSVNTACFLMAALLNEGIVKRSEKEPRRYELGDPKPFMAEVQASMAPEPKHKKGEKKPPPDILPAEPVVDPPADPVEPIVEADSQSC